MLRRLQRQGEEKTPSDGTVRHWEVWRPTDTLEPKRFKKLVVEEASSLKEQI